MSAGTTAMGALTCGVAAVALAGCGGGQTQGAAFDPQWQSDNGVAIGELQQQLAKVPIPIGADVAVGASANVIYGLPLDGGAPWSFPHVLETRPAIAGSVVVGIGGGELFALDAHTGKPLWQRPGAGLLRGVGDDGKTTIVSLASMGKGSVVLAVRHDGGVIRQIEDTTAIGVPAVIDGYAFLPWQGQYVTAYDLAGGEEKARVLLRSQTSRAFTTGGGLFFGELAATRFDDKIRLGAAGRASTFSLPTRELPAAPNWMPSGVDPEPVRASAPDKVRLYARPRVGGEAGVESDRFAATYYRIALGFEATGGEIAWAHLHDADFLGGAAYAGGIALCDAKGKVTFFDARTGGIAGQAAFGREIDACVVQTDGLKKEAKPAPKPLAGQIADCVRSQEQELATIQKFLLRELVTLKDDAVTDALIELASSERTSPFLLGEARAALGSRRSGAEFMLKALARHYDYLAGVTRPPPVAPLADALAAMKEKRAAPLLALHLSEPSNAPEAIQHAAAALSVLADKPEVPALKAFFAMYRAASGLEGQEQIDLATVDVAQALVRLGEGGVVTAAASDRFTSPGVKTRIANLRK